MAQALELDIFHKPLCYRLCEASIQRELIDASSFRGIGKTHALVEFAKNYDLDVIVNNDNIARLLREREDYGRIYSQNNLIGTRIKRAVVDEEVNLDKIPSHIDVVTGFVRS